MHQKVVSPYIYASLEEFINDSGTCNSVRIQSMNGSILKAQLQASQQKIDKIKHLSLKDCNLDHWNTIAAQIQNLKLTSLQLARLSHVIINSIITALPSLKVKTILLKINYEQMKELISYLKNDKHVKKIYFNPVGADTDTIRLIINSLHEMENLDEIYFFKVKKEVILTALATANLPNQGSISANIYITDKSWNTTKLISFEQVLSSQKKRSAQTRSPSRLSIFFSSPPPSSTAIPQELLYVSSSNPFNNC